MAAASSWTPLELNLADSIWLKNDDLSVQEDYLETCANTLDAQAFEAPFDNTTLQDINAWVDENTHGMIPQIIDDISPDSRLFLISALAFEGAWDDPYEDESVLDWTFTAQDGSQTDCRMMRSREDSYLENDSFTGFIKPYRDYNFGFAGLLPKEGLTLDQALDSLDGAALANLLTPRISRSQTPACPSSRLNTPPSSPPSSKPWACSMPLTCRRPTSPLWETPPKTSMWERSPTKRLSR